MPEEQLLCPPSAVTWGHSSYVGELYKNSQHPAAWLLLDFIFQKAIHQPKCSDNTSYSRIHTWQSGCGSRDGEGKVNVLMPSARTGSERAWVSPGQTEEIIHSVIVETDHSRNRWSTAKTCHVVSALPAVALTPNPSVVSSGYFLSVIAWWSETTETWLALSRSQTLVCYTIGNRSWHEANEELFMARAGRPYPLGVSGPQGNGGQQSSANTPAAICAANIGSRQRKAETTQGSCVTWLCYMTQAKLSTDSSRRLGVKSVMVWESQDVGVVLKSIFQDYSQAEKRRNNSSGWRPYLLLCFGKLRSLLWVKPHSLY